ncbi:lipocalin-like domain-containing protein [Formosa sp. A9]|uniref:lipocalin-like domain-containing protein n=1 Tax=Formosa sp. A9 TaxID=3442641 RepID=UPI003EBA26B0
MKINLTTLILACFTVCLSYAQDWKTYPYTPEGSLITFPKDEGAHTAEAIEWWYTSGEVTGETTGKTYAYMLSYFDYSYAGFDGFRILNLRDLSTGEFFQSTLPLTYNTLSTEAISIEAVVFRGITESWRNKLDHDNNSIPFQYTITAASDNGKIEFDYNTVKRPLIIGDTGLIDQGASRYSYYFSQTKNEVSGQITLNGVTENVIGTAWIDRQYGSFNPLSSEKYEWFSLQLSNDMDINLWNIFTAEGSIPDNSKFKILSAYVDDNTQYTISDFEIERLAFNCMPDLEKCYSKKWRLTSESKNIDLTIETRYDDAEVTLPFRFYEGTITISGTINGESVTGIGFAELVHTYENPSITLNAFADNMYSADTPISWMLNNPDDGRKVYYDVLYSTDGEEFISIVTDLTDTSFIWEQPALDQDASVWFKVVAHSVDGTLSSEVVSEALQYSTLSVASSVLNQVKLFPNPVQTHLYITMPFAVTRFQYEIIDVSGRLVLKNQTTQQDSNTLEIPLNQLTSGIYILRCTTQHTQKSFKFIKQ